ncbi:DUF4387 domain-containing protein [Sulfitobacter sp. SK012]|uniref:DUF4387 family protein n=1 Tax=Sulfitobacter sp. SK012 TaxID=1389005 RepID=UPI000E0BD184|nr:DUF4387 family protein [Sulfitobacter sp. SK012]AXI47673.1 DUF4387 domain-containing protein [Sulfitobacter sp. SK012]
MKPLGSLVQKLRSKNAGPFWLTIDIFCGSPEAYETVVELLDTAAVATALGAKSQDLKRFDIPSLNVIKISLPRPTIQGAADDRDMHGASWAALLAELPV